MIKCQTPAKWYVYLLRCNDDSLYTGATTDLQRRLRQHNHGSDGARYTRSRRPVTLAYAETVEDRATALRREYQIKQLPRSEKQALIQQSPWSGDLTPTALPPTIVPPEQQSGNNK